MKRIYANTADSRIFPAPTPEGRTIKIREAHGCGSDVVTCLTRMQERREAQEQQSSTRNAWSGENRMPSWVRIAKNRIKFRHDEKRGPASHVLWHAVF